MWGLPRPEPQNVGPVPGSEWPVPVECILWAWSLILHNYSALMGTYLNFDESKTTFSGRTVLLYLGLVAKLWGDPKLCKNLFTFMDVSDQKVHILFFAKKIIFFINWARVFRSGARAWGVPHISRLEHRSQ